MLKHKITATEYAELSDEMKAHYAVQPDMSYNIDLGPTVFIDTEDPARLKASLEAERAETKKAKAAADRLEAEKKEAERSKITDIDQLRESFKQEIDDYKKEVKEERKREADEKKQALQRVVEGQVKAKALELSAKLFGTNAALMLPHVEQRLGVINGDTDNPTVGIMNVDTGQQAVDQNFENFEKSLSTHPSFSPMVVATKASGGGANDGNRFSSLANTTDDGKTKTYRDYSPAELLQIKKEEPDRFESLKSTR